MKKGGILLAGMDNGINFLIDDNGTQPLVIANKLPFNPLKESKERFEKMREQCD